MKFITLRKSLLKYLGLCNRCTKFILPLQMSNSGAQTGVQSSIGGISGQSVQQQIYQNQIAQGATHTDTPLVNLNYLWVSFRVY